MSPKLKEKLLYTRTPCIMILMREIPETQQIKWLSSEQLVKISTRTEQQHYWHCVDFQRPDTFYSEY